MSDRSRDDQSKRFNREYEDADFLRAIEECTVASTTNVSDVVGCNRKTARRRLKKLEDRNAVEVVETIGRANIWAVVAEDCV